MEYYNDYRFTCKNSVPYSKCGMYLCCLLSVTENIVKLSEGILWLFWFRLESVSSVYDNTVQCLAMRKISNMLLSKTPFWKFCPMFIKLGHQFSFIKCNTHASGELQTSWYDLLQVVGLTKNFLCVCACTIGNRDWGVTWGVKLNWI